MSRIKRYAEETYGEEWTDLLENGVFENGE